MYFKSTQRAVLGVRRYNQILDPKFSSAQCQGESVFGEPDTLPREPELCPCNVGSA